MNITSKELNLNDLINKAFVDFCSQKVNGAAKYKIDRQGFDMLHDFRDFIKDSLSSLNLEDEYCHCNNLDGYNVIKQDVFWMHLSCGKPLNPSVAINKND